MPLIGYLHSASPEAYASMISAFHGGLKETGYVQGRNVAIEFRWAEGHVERLPALADDLVRRRISVLATGGGASPALAAKQGAAAIPTPILSPDYLTDLNKEQCRAVKHGIDSEPATKAPPLLVIAGPGSGPSPDIADSEFLRCKLIFPTTIRRISRFPGLLGGPSID
jgi:hypothetical protein